MPIRLHEIRVAVITDQGTFRNINNVSLTTTDRIRRGNHMAMKQLFRVPFQRNSDVVKEARCQFVEVRKHYYNNNNLYFIDPTLGKLFLDSCTDYGVSVSCPRTLEHPTFWFADVCPTY